MTPEKLYIPTTTLNFNNIMSSESISPASFYARREFGYKRFEKVAPNSLDNRIILYAKHPTFNINDEEFENYPMVIEIYTKNLRENIIKECDSTYYTEETIYLNPFTTKILFRNEQERTRTLSKAEQSIETKMVSLYKNCFSLKSDNIESENWVKSTIKDTANDISKHISNDIKTNKLKGFMYAYLIASNKSTSDEVVKLKMYTKKLRNTLSAIVTNPDGRASYQQSEQLEFLYNSINETLYKAEGLPKKMESVIKQKSEKYKCSNFREILQGEGLFDTWLQKQNIKPSYKLPLFPSSGFSKSSTEVLATYMHPLEQQISKIEFSEKKTRTSKGKLPVIQNRAIAQIFDQDIKGNFLIKLFNNYLEEAYKSEEFLQSRYEFTKSGVLTFKEEIKGWNGSQAQKYLNALRANLNEHTPFEVNNTNNLTLKSFACFCQKGEADINKLEDYLILNEIGDFRIAFGLWGAVFGFANMPKTFTNDLFLSNDLFYVNEVYKYIYKQMHGVDLEGERDITSPTQRSSTKEISTATTRLERQDNSSIHEFRTKLKKCKSKLSPEQIDKICEQHQNNFLRIDEKFFSNIKKIQGIGDKKIESIKIALYFNTTTPSENLLIFKNSVNEEELIDASVSTKQNTFENKSKKNQITSTEPPVNIAPKQKNFYMDEKAFEVIIKPLLNEDYCDKKTIDSVKGILNWFQNNYKEQFTDKNGLKQQGQYSTSQKDNNSVIENFNQHAQRPWNKGNTNPKIEASLLEKIIAKLLEVYQ